MHPQRVLLVRRISGLQLDWTPSRRTQKINLLANQKGYDKSETTYEELSARKSRSVLFIFVKFIFDIFFKTTFQIMSGEKIDKTELNLPR